MSRPMETSSLLPKTEEDGSSPFDAALSSESVVTKFFVVVQAALVVLFSIGTTYSDKDYEVKEYIAFRDIMAMLLLGFGFLMTFLSKYGLGAVGFTMMLSVLSIELNVFVELLVRILHGEASEGEEETSWPMPVTISTLIDGEFAAATLMITFGALIGRATPLQMIIVCLSQSFWYAFNKVVLVLGVIGAEDVGGSMTIHMFGAYFGLAASYALGGPKDVAEADEAAMPDKVSDVLALIGTTVLWIFWPSFVGATETGILLNEHHCVVNTIVALLGSTTVTFFLSQRLCHGRFDPVHVANSTLAGGVAIGSVGRLNIGPGAAYVTGLLAGAASVYGYVYSSPFLASKFNIHDTCGVGNLHGYPSVVGAVLSIFFIVLDDQADFLDHPMGSQMIRQFGGIVATLGVSIVSGYGTGRVAAYFKEDATANYLDSVWWHLEY